ncbi:hypothetical protein BMS3Bbin10_00568 [bacterium BMS3Bbin10]|nr:hypothetical protein BMS3Bbin10_00568 [bacterium BMS3Bbin10]
MRPSRTRAERGTTSCAWVFSLEFFRSRYFRSRLFRPSDGPARARPDRAAAVRPCLGCASGFFRSRLFRFAGLRDGGLTAGPQWPAALRAVWCNTALSPACRSSVWGHRQSGGVSLRNRAQRGKRERAPPGQGAPAQAPPEAGTAVSENKPEAQPRQGRTAAAPYGARPRRPARQRGSAVSEKIPEAKPRQGRTAAARSGRARAGPRSGLAVSEKNDAPSASAPAHRRDSRKSRAPPCGQAIRPRHISPAADRDGILCRQAPHRAPA